MIKTTIDGDTITHVLPDGRINVITDGEKLSARIVYPAPQYTVQREKKSGELWGPVHASNDASEALCGVDIDGGWMILSNDAKGEFNCKNCRRFYAPSQPAA